MGFSCGIGVDLLIEISTRDLDGWLGNKIYAGESGRALLLGQLSEFHFFNTKRIYLFFFFFYFLIHLTNLLIYSRNYLFLIFWYFLIHKLNWFSQSKTLFVFECLFCSFTVHVCPCVSVTYLYVCLYIPLYFVYACCLFVWDLYMFVPTLVCICVRLFVFTILRECVFVFINCEMIRALQ